MQLQGKLINQIWENGKKPSLGSIFVHLAQIRAAIFFFFFNCLALQVTRCYGQLSWKLSEKTNDPILKTTV